MATQLYFAYGSNIDRTQMLHRCPGSRQVGEAWLDGWRLVFAGRSVTRGGPVATLVVDEDASTPGLLYRMPRRDIEQLDMYEGSAYRRRSFKVFAGTHCQAFTYIMMDQPLGIPPLAYIGQIFASSLRASLPTEHLLPWLERSICRNDMKSLRNMDARDILAHVIESRRNMVRQNNSNVHKHLQASLWNHSDSMRNSKTMQGRKTQLTEMIDDDPAQARQTVIVHLVANRGNIAAAARSLGISRRTAHRYVEQLGLGNDVARLRRERAA